MAWMTLNQVKDHLRLPVVANDPGDADLTLKLAAAEAAITEFIHRNTPAGLELIATWGSTPPAFVQHAVLIQTAELWRFRGDDLEGPPRVEGVDLAPAVVHLLRRVAQPVIGLTPVESTP